MNIAYDILLKEPELVPAVRTVPDLDAVFGQLFDYVNLLLKPLEDEINS